MEHSTSLRSLEASGRPSGTGRPSLSSPRSPEREREASPERAKGQRESAEAQASPETPEPGAQAPERDFPLVLERHAARRPEVDPATPGAEPALAAPLEPQAEAPRLLVALALPDAAPAPEAREADPSQGEPQLALPLPLPAPAPATVASDVSPANAVGEADAPELTPAQTLPAGPATPTTQAPPPRELAWQPAHETPRASTPAPAAPPPDAPPPRNDPERAGLILRQLRVHLSPELRSATIQLAPAELGRISIRIELERGELSAVVRAEKHEALDALQRHIPELKATLEQQGIHARRFELELGFQDAPARHEQDRPQSRRAGSRPSTSTSLPREDEQPLVRALSAGIGGIDTYA